MNQSQGHETTALTMSAVLLLLAMHPEIQEKAIKELQNVFQNFDEDVKDEQLPKLVYLEMIIKETMRLIPVVPFFGRFTTGEVQLG